MSAFSKAKCEYIFKILVIGELGSGKTSIIKRYVHQFFSQHYRATIGVDFALKILNWDESTVVRLQLWDIAGQERFGNMTRVYYRDAAAAFVVFDLTRIATFEAAAKWKMDLDQKVQSPDGSPIPAFLLGNKCDLQREAGMASDEDIAKFSRDNNFLGWCLVSAKEGTGIEEAASRLVGKLLTREDRQARRVRPVSLLHLGQDEEDADKNRSCCK